jgi:hypothetical protein
MYIQSVLLSCPRVWQLSLDAINCCVQGHNEMNVLYMLIMRIKDCLSVVICNMVE